jgi:hypothetical protein
MSRMAAEAKIRKGQGSRVVKQLVEKLGALKKRRRSLRQPRKSLGKALYPTYA